MNFLLEQFEDAKRVYAEDPFMKPCCNSGWAKLDKYYSVLQPWYCVHNGNGIILKIAGRRNGMQIARQRCRSSGSQNRSRLRFQCRPKHLRQQNKQIPGSLMPLHRIFSGSNKPV
jgi:hypothetical protein